MSTPCKPFNICDTLRKRLQEINNKKEATQSKINTSSEQLQKLFSKGNKTSRLTPAQLDAKIDDLERTRTSSSLPLSQEKEILRQIGQIKKSKVLHEENRVHEQLIQEKKTEVTNLRTELNSIKAQIAELEAALSKVELADRLGCSANDLKSHIMECPVDKLGQVIGKGGSNIKRMESKTGCLIDLDKVKFQIHLQGNESSIEEAIVEIENITLAIEVEMKIGHALSEFLMNKHLAEFSTLQKNHPNVNFDLSKEDRSLKLRGRETFVTTAKEDIMRIDVRMETLQIPGREAALIVGKGGKTINRLVEAHDVAIQVENKKNGSGDTSTIIVSGKGDKVDEAMKEIKDILFKSEEMEVSLLVTAMSRNKFLSDAGAHIKQLQKDVNEACQPGNSFVRFEELAKDERESASILIVKAPRMHIAEAEKIVKERIETYDSAVITMHVDIDIIPVIIGSKGSTIKSIRKSGGSGADIEVDKFTGEVKILADEESGRQTMKDAIDALISENQILRVPMEKAMFLDLFGQSGKAVKTKIQNSGVFIRIDDSDTAILLRGSIEKIAEAAGEVRQFISSNQSIDIPVEDDEESFLSRRTSLLKKIEKEHDVRVNNNKARRVVVIRGTVEGINAAEYELKQILFGGNGYSVEKFFVPPSITGAIIGKAGKNILKYESDFSVMVNTHTLSRSLSIRGPFEQVELCKVMINKDMMECNVNETIQLDSVGLSKVSNPGAISKIVGDLPITYNISPTSLRLRGAYTDVQEAVTNVKDLLTGVYTAVIMLIPDHFLKVSRAAENPAHFDRICEPTSTTISLDDTMGAVVIEGKRSNVRRAKSLLITFLESVAPSQITKVKFLKPLLKSMGSSKDTAKVAMQTGCIVSLERDICTFILQATSREKLQHGMQVIESKIEACMKLTHVAQVESWLMQYLLTQNVNDVEKIRNDCECEIVVSRNDLLISIIGKEESNVSNAKQMLDVIMEQAKKENTFIDLPESSMEQFFGTSGKHMKSIASMQNVNIERIKKTKSRIRIQGNEASVTRTVKVVNEWVSKWEKKNGGLTIALDDSAMTLLEKEKSVLDDIQKEFGVKVDINRIKSTATIRGGKADSQKKAGAKLESVLSEVSVKDTMDSGNKENATATILNTSTPYVNDPVIRAPIAQAPIAEVQPEMNPKNTNNAVGKLYNLLVSDDVAAGVVATDAQEWDSSTVSSGLESEIESPETGVSYYRSASGFHIRL